MAVAALKSDALTSEAGENDSPAATTGASSPKLLARGREFLARRWLLLLMSAWVVANVAVFAYYKAKLEVVAVPPPDEISVGTFHFEADKSEHGRITSAKFSLCVSVHEENDATARRRLSSRKLRVQQAVEELLRRAHSGDFEDPKLKEFKRQILEQIDETLGVRAVAEVIVTDLAVVWATNPP
jgi:flagellar basal body-associated protein FliL